MALCRHYLVLESIILLLSVSICSSLPPGDRTVHTGEREKTSKEADSLSSSSYHPAHIVSIHRSETSNPSTTITKSYSSHTATLTDVSSTTVPHKSNVLSVQGSELVRSKFDHLLHYKPQRHKAEESSDLQPENLLKVKHVEEEGTDQQVWKMVITIASAITALFGMCMFSAIFLCCCRKKRRTITTEEETDRKNLIDKKGSPPTKTKVKDDQGEEKAKIDETEDKLIRREDEQVKKGTESQQETNTTEDGDDEADSVQIKIKAFEVKKDSPSPRPGNGKDAVRPPKRRPESEAFKNFESKGILIGMGKAPKRKTEPEPEISEDEEKQDKVITPIVITGKPGAKIQEKAKEKSNGSYPILPEVHVTATDDSDLGDFSVVKRETEVLKSHRRAAPPSGRNRMSKAAMLKARHTTVGVLGEDTTDTSDTDQIQQIKAELEADEENQDVVEPSASVTQILVKDIKADSDRTQNIVPKHKMTNSEQDKASEDKKESDIVAEVKSSRDNEKIDSLESNPASLDTGGNIFFHIDPTAKSKSMGDIARIGVNTASRTESSEPKTTEKRINSNPNPKQDALVSALKRKLHSSVDDAESNESVSHDEDDMDPVKRERTFSEPTSPRS